MYLFELLQLSKKKNDSEKLELEPGSRRFLEACRHLKMDGRVKSKAALSRLLVVGDDRVLYRIEHGQAVTIDYVSVLVATYGVNPSWFYNDAEPFYSKGASGAASTASATGTTGVVASGTNNIIHAGEGGISGNSFVQQSDSIINKVPPPLRDGVSGMYEQLRGQILSLNQDIENLKQIIQSYEDKVTRIEGERDQAREKKDEIYDRYVALLESRNS